MRKILLLILLVIPLIGHGFEIGATISAVDVEKRPDYLQSHLSIPFERTTFSESSNSGLGLHVRSNITKLFTVEYGFSLIEYTSVFTGRSTSYDANVRQEVKMTELHVLPTLRIPFGWDVSLNLSAGVIGSNQRITATTDERVKGPYHTFYDSTELYTKDKDFSVMKGVMLSIGGFEFFRREFELMDQSEVTIAGVGMSFQL